MNLFTFFASKFLKSAGCLHSPDSFLGFKINLRNLFEFFRESFLVQAARFFGEFRKGNKNRELVSGLVTIGESSGRSFSTTQCSYIEFFNRKTIRKLEIYLREQIDLKANLTLQTQSSIMFCMIHLLHASREHQPEVK